MKYNQSRLGFELWLLCPFPTTITIAPRAPPYIYIHIYILTGIYSGDDSLIKTHVLHSVHNHEEANTTCCLLQAMLQGFGLGRCICKERYAGKSARMLRVILNKSWKQHSIKLVMFSFGPLHMDVPVLADYQERTQQLCEVGKPDGFDGW